MGVAADRLQIEPLSGDHDRSRFTSGSEPLDRYLRERASQDIKRRISRCFVAVSCQTQEIAGFYTLAATSVALDALAPDIATELPRYPVVFLPWWWMRRMPPPNASMSTTVSRCCPAMLPASFCRSQRYRGCLAVYDARHVRTAHARPAR